MSGNMTGAELQTMREGCHLTREDLAGLADVQARTIKYWEHGRAGVPADVAELVRRIDTAVSLACNEALHQVRDAAQLAGAYPADIVLLRYQVADVLTYHVELCGFASGGMGSETAAAIHGAIVNRVRLMLPWFDGLERVRVVWMRSELYQDWLTAQGAADSEAARSAWAAGQVAAQAMAHRADQPPVDGGV